MIFFDVKVFNPNARRYTKKGLSKTYQLTEKEKKRYYNEQIMQVEHGTREMYQPYLDSLRTQKLYKDKV